MKRLLPLLLAAACVVTPAELLAYAFGVSPIRLDFSASERSGAITVSNDDRVPVSFQMRLVRWSQDAKGEDVYEDNKDLIYFPRLMSVEPQEKRVIRVGTQGELPAVESTYRLVIEEMLPPGAKPSGPAVAVRMRFAVPVFVAPAQGAAKPALEDVTVAKGEVRFRLRNAGNQHLKLETIALRRGESTLKEAAGWYVLAGAARGFSLEIPAGECGRPGPLQLVLKGEGVELSRELVVDANRCKP